MSILARAGTDKATTKRSEKLLVAMPEPGLSLTQDAEWCVVRINGKWQQIRFHDYDKLFSIPGLYEKVLYGLLDCDSPRVVRGLLQEELESKDADPTKLRAFDLGAGNGMVGEELRDLGAEFAVGVDIIPQAAQAAERDRPGVYDHYEVVDLTDLGEEDKKKLAGYRCNLLTCVAALGFGDIPPAAFAAAFNVLDDGAWVAFNIKDCFLDGNDRSDFGGMLKRMMDDGVLVVHRKKRYAHRRATNGDELDYVAIIGSKVRDIPSSMMPR